jgi:hypothetical protein
MSKKETLDKTHPNLVKDWHPTKNGDLFPISLTHGSNRKVWWKCAKGDDHEWEDTISHRSSGRGCPVCSGYKVVHSNCLSTTHLHLAKEWHSKMNNELKPSDVTYGSNRKVWWKCAKGDDHEWEASISNRARLGRGCSVCAGKKVVMSNCLATTHPYLVKEWHPNRNGTLNPKHFVAGAGRKVWWKCDKGDDHEWEAKISNRAILNRSCPVCSGYKVVYSNSLQNVYPKLAKELHPHKNGKLTADKIYAGGKNQYWWKCDKGDDHEWEADIPHRVRANKPGGCPICINRKIVTSNRLTITNPNIAKEWHPTKNGKLNPSHYTAGSLKKVWWKCDKGDDHEWKTTISKRVQWRQNCPVCINKKIVLSNCLKTTHLHLIDEWDFERNTIVLPTKVGAGSHKRVWWKCKINNHHIWRAIIYTRALNGYGCPFCTLTPQSREELVILFELKSIFKNINPKGYKIKIDKKLKAIDIYIPELTLAVEYDGSYWHQNKKEVDKRKSKILLDEGMDVIRLRQKPLKKIFKNDILVENKFNGKKITDDILTQIKDNYDLNKLQLKKINKYLESDDLHNEKSMQTFIDMILKGK